MFCGLGMNLKYISETIFLLTSSLEYIDLEVQQNYWGRNFYSIYHIASLGSKLRSPPYFQYVNSKSARIYVL